MDSKAPSFSDRLGFCSAQFDALRGDERVYRLLNGEEVNNEQVNGAREWVLKAISRLTQRVSGSLG